MVADWPHGVFVFFAVIVLYVGLFGLGGYRDLGAQQSGDVGLGSGDLRILDWDWACRHIDFGHSLFVSSEMADLH